MSERAEYIAEAVSEKVAPEENIQLEEQAPPPSYEDLEAGRPPLSQTAGPASLSAPPIATSVVIRFLTIVGYCTLVTLCTAYGYTDIRIPAHHDGSNTLVNVLYSGVIGGTVLGVPFSRKGSIFDKYHNRSRATPISLVAGCAGVP